MLSTACHMIIVRTAMLTSFAASGEDARSLLKNFNAVS
jgi:hypothetical protein